MNFINLFPTIDLFALFVFAAIVLLDMIFVKKEKLFIDFLDLYITFAIVILAPLFSQTVASWFLAHDYVRFLAFLIIKFGLLFILWHSNLGDFSKKVSPTKATTSFIYRLSLMGLFSTMIVYLLPVSIKSLLGPLTLILFGNLIAMLVWLVLPLFFAFAYRFETRRGWVD